MLCRLRSRLLPSSPLSGDFSAEVLTLNVPSTTQLAEPPSDSIDPPLLNSVSDSTD